MTPRLQNKISGSISGWYGNDWLTNIKWHGSNLMVKDKLLAEEIIYNLQHDINKTFIINKPIDLEFIDWDAEISIG